MRCVRAEKVEAYEVEVEGRLKRRALFVDTTVFILCRDA